ncbi:MAG: hypothetical protein ABIN74_14205, partial [Ferruginibacter sp.]
VSVYLYPGSYFTHVDLYKINGQLSGIENTGHVTGFRKLTLAPRDTCYIMARLKPLKNEFNNINPVLVENDFITRYKQIVVGNKSDLQIFGMVISGVLLMMILFMITNFIISRKTEFLYNALYSFCMFLLIYFNSIVAKNPGPFTQFYYSYFDFFLLVAGTLFYIGFTRKFLDTNTRYVQLDKFLKYGERFILLLLAIYTWLHFFFQYIPATVLPGEYHEVPDPCYRGGFHIYGLETKGPPVQVYCCRQCHACIIFTHFTQPHPVWYKG